MLGVIWYHLYNLKKREKQPWRSVTFTKSITPPWVCFSHFCKMSNGTNLCKASHTSISFCCLRVTGLVKIHRNT